jgi:hypothetical protein
VNSGWKMLSRELGVGSKERGAWISGRRFKKILRLSALIYISMEEIFFTSTEIQAWHRPLPMTIIHYRLFN